MFFISWSSNSGNCGAHCFFMFRLLILCHLLLSFKISDSIEVGLVITLARLSTSIFLPTTYMFIWKLFPELLEFLLFMLRLQPLSTNLIVFFLHSFWIGTIGYCLRVNVTEHMQVPFSVSQGR